MKAFIASVCATSALSWKQSSCDHEPVYSAPAASYGASYGARSYGGASYGGASYGAGAYGVSSYGAGYGAGSYGAGYGAGAYGAGYGDRSYGVSAYGAGVGSYGAGYGSYGRGYASPSRGYGYQPTVVKKEYGAWSKAYRLDVETYQKTVIEDTENVWVVAFIDENCGGCVRLAVEWEKLQTVRTITARRVRFAYVDTARQSTATIVQNYCGGHKVQQTPTVFVYGRNKYAPQVYAGDYSSNSLNSYICDLCDRDGYGISGGYGGYGAGYGAGYGGAYGGAYGADAAYTRAGVSDSVQVGETVSTKRVGGSYVTPAVGYGSGYGSGYGGYGSGYGSGYGGQRVIGVAGRTSNSRVVDVDYDRQTRAGLSQGGYSRTSVQPGYGYSSPSYGGYSGW